MTHPTQWSLKQNLSDKVTSDKNCSQRATYLNSTPGSHRNDVWFLLCPTSITSTTAPRQRRTHRSRVNVGVCVWRRVRETEWIGWVFPEGTCGRWGRRGWGYRHKEVCRLWCDGRVCMSPGELRKIYAERVPVTDTQIREVKASLQAPASLHIHHDKEGGEMKSKGEIWSNPEIPSFQNLSSHSFEQPHLLMYLYGGFSCDVCNQEVHGDVLTVHMSIHPVLNVSRHLIRVQIIKVLKQKQRITSCINRSLLRFFLTLQRVRISQNFSHLVVEGCSS